MIDYMLNYVVINIDTSQNIYGPAHIFVLEGMFITWESIKKDEAQHGLTMKNGGWNML